MTATIAFFHVFALNREVLKKNLKITLAAFIYFGTMCFANYAMRDTVEKYHLWGNIDKVFIFSVMGLALFAVWWFALDVVFRLTVEKQGEDNFFPATFMSAVAFMVAILLSAFAAEAAKDYVLAQCWAVVFHLVAGIVAYLLLRHAAKEWMTKPRRR